MLTVKEVFEKTGVPEGRIYYEIERGYLKAVKKYNRMLITETEFRKFQEKVERKRRFLTIIQFCEKKGITRPQFQTLLDNGKLETEKIDEELYIISERKEE